MQLLQYVEGLPGERHDVLFPHLHACRRDAPLGFLEVDLFPLRMSELTWPDKGKGSQLQRTARDESSSIPFNRSEEFPNLFGLVDASEMALLGRGDGTAQVGRNVTFRTSGSQDVAEYLSALLQIAAGGFHCPPAFDAANDGEKFGRGDLADGARSDVGEDALAQARNDGLGRVRGPGVLELFKSLLGD